MLCMLDICDLVDVAMYFEWSNVKNSFGVLLVRDSLQGN